MAAKPAKKVVAADGLVLRIHACSWNVAEEKPDDDLTEWLGLDCDVRFEPAVLVVGLQEVDHQDQWEEKILKLLTQRGYTRVKQRSLAWLYTAAYVQQRHLAKVTNVESEATKTGFAGMIPNKGAVSVRFDFYGVNLIFVNSHFTAHHPNTNERIADYDDILDGQKFRDADVDSILDHDYVFWFGDLNFRIDELSKSDIERAVDDGDLGALRAHDQLNKARAEELIFVDFEEGATEFHPTYKYDKGTDVYDTSAKQRKPAWTDRILWMVHEDAFDDVALGAKLLWYGAYPEYKTSDHKPIGAKFDIVVMNNAPELPVKFAPIASPIGTRPMVSVAASYHCAGELSVSSWDWLGLYRRGFKHVDDYETWAYGASGGGADAKKRDDVPVTFTDTEKLSGEFVVAYFNRKKNCLVGYSNVFEIQSE
ncbi:inositol polyphosphate 5-phosphatase K-like [Tubulanus polymorphus]|uniref:inositol polyphosphate 5-phosphatase K-like n=1 Tax=Tubulanus polymorphus TaxID=672921 RepID=UPI003DA20DB5